MYIAGSPKSTKLSTKSRVYHRDCILQGAARSVYTKGSIATLDVIPRKHEAECIPKAVPSVASVTNAQGSTAMCVQPRDCQAECTFQDVPN